MSAPQYTLSSQERQYFAQLYGIVSGGPGGVPADSAVNLFAKSSPGLSTTVLAEVWNLADYGESGTLTSQGFDIACRLIGHAQAGTSISRALINTAGPLPRFEGITPTPLQAQSTGSRVTFSPMSSSASAAKVAPADKERFVRMFNAQGPVDGMLSGEKAGALFLKSNLPNTTLAQIWKLSDTRERGELDVTEFVIGMHLIQKIMSGAMQSPLPETLPAGLYESAQLAPQAATPLLPPGIPRQLTGTRTPASPIRQQFTGQQAPFGASRNLAWSITPAEKQQSDGWFDGLQLNSQGLLEGAQAVEFFTKSGLDAVVLANIWDLSDIRKAGSLTKDEFAIATRLINDQLDGKSLPAALPPDLIPPSLRGFAPTPSRQSTAVERDLFSLLDEDQPPASAVATPTPAPARSVASPTRSVASPKLPAARVASPSAAISRSVAKSPDIMTGGELAPSRVASGAEMGNLKAQLSSTTSSLEKTRGERAQLETAVNNSSSDMAALQAQLEAARTAYTTESSLLSSLQTRAANQTTELAALRSTLITAESDLSALRVERAEIEQNVLRDKEEIRTLKAKLVETDRETERLKSEADAKRKEAKQQRGMVAITKKQVERSEEKRNLARTDLESASAASIVEPAVNSPAASVRSTNPFERLQGDTTGQAASSGLGTISPQSTGNRQAPPVPPSRSKTLNADAPNLSALASAGVGMVAAGAATAAALAAEGVKSLVGSGEAAVGEHGSTLASTGAADEELGAESRFPEVGATRMAKDDSTPAALQSNGFDDSFAEPPTDAVGSSGADNPSVATASTNENVDAAFSEATMANKPPVSMTTNGFEDEFGAPPPLTTETGAATFDAVFSEPSAPVQPVGLSNATSRGDEDSSDEEGPAPAEGFHYGGANSTSASRIENTSFGKNVPHSMPGGFASSSSAGPRPPSVASSAGGDTFEDARQNVVESPAHPHTSAFRSSSVSRTADDFDEFDREFDDLPNATDPSTLQGAPLELRNHANFDDDAFSQDFDRFEDFAPKPSKTASVPTSSSAAFDAAFAGFDSPSNPASSAAGDGGFSAAFDDSFGAAPALAPALPARGASAFATGSAKQDDAPDVKQVIALGFTRQQAIQALEKSSYNVQAAINSLLDSQ